MGHSSWRGTSCTGLQAVQEKWPAHKGIFPKQSPLRDLGLFSCGKSPSRPNWRCSVGLGDSRASPEGVRGKVRIIRSSDLPSEELFPHKSSEEQQETRLLPQAAKVRQVRKPPAWSSQRRSGPDFPAFREHYRGWILKNNPNAEFGAVLKIHPDMNLLCAQIL